MDPTPAGPRLPVPPVVMRDPIISESVPIVARPVTGPLPVVEVAPPRRHHTLLPRALCLAGQLMWLAVPVVVVLLQRADRVTWADNGVPEFDADGRRLLALVALSSAGAYLLGWVWWATVAAANARHLSRRAVWPGSAMVALAVQVATVAVARSVHLDDDLADTSVSVVAWAVVAAAHFWVLGAFRRTAESIRSSPIPWTRVIAIPWGVAALNVVAAFFVGFVSTEVTLAVIGLQLLAMAWYVASFYQAMATFDRACIGRAVLSQDEHSFAAFTRAG